MTDSSSANADAHSEQAASDLRSAAQGFRDAAVSKTREIISDTGDKARVMKERALEKAQVLRDSAGEKAGELRANALKHGGELRDMADEQWEQIRDKSLEIHDSLEDYVRRHPTKCILGAVGVGFVLGLLSSRR